MVGQLIVGHVLVSLVILPAISSMHCSHLFIFIMAALYSRCGHYIFVLFFSFFLSSFLLSFFPRLISAVAGWMSTILLHMVWP